MLGSKELGTNVLELYFVMLANHDQNVLVLFRPAQIICFLCKVGIKLLEDLLCKSGWLDQSRIRLDRSKLRQNVFFCKIFQLSLNSFDVQGFIFCPRYKRENPSHVLSCFLCCVCEFFVRSRDGCLHTYLGLSRTRLCQELDDRFSCYFKSLKIYKQECLCLLEIQERSSPWTQSCCVVVVVSFLLKVAIGCQWFKSLLCKLQFFHSGFSFTLRIVKLNPSQVFYQFGFLGLSYCCVFYFPHFTII